MTLELAPEMMTETKQLMIGIGPSEERDRI